MSNGLFIRQYPAPGATVVPATFRAGKYGYMMVAVCGLWFVLTISGAANSLGIYCALIAYAIISVCAAIYLHNLKLEIRLDGICYSNVFGRVRSVAYPEISSAVLLTSSSPGYRGSVFHIPGTMLVTPRVDSGKASFRIPLYLFPVAGREQLIRLLRPESWDVSS